MKLSYYKIDENLPDLVFDKNNIGIDLYARENVTIRQGEHKFIPLNIVLKGDLEYVYLLFPRSSMFGKYNILLTNSIGIIDPSYEGINDEIKASVYRPETTNNRSVFDNVIHVNKGDRIVQLVILKREMVELDKVKEFWGSNNRGGFGSTGVK